MTNEEAALVLAQKVNECGGTAFYVGGYVRDQLLGIENKDIDIEVHGIECEKLEEILDQIGQRMEFGKSFGVYNLKGYDIDIALPRKEVLIGNKHTDFKIDVDPFIGTKKAAERRDFTINALMKNVLTGEIVDHYHGLEDLKNHLIRHINPEKFVEDPLRVLRGAQFASRFEFTIAQDTIELCKTIDLTSLSKERVFGEMNKALLKANKPSIFFEQLKLMNGLDDWFSQLKNLIGVKQNPRYHAEGDVYTHTLMVIDEAAKHRNQVSYPLGFMISAVVHDFGKAITTEEIDGVIHSYQHEIKGLPLVQEFIEKLSTDSYLLKYCLNMTKNHMRPLVLANNNSSIKATNKLYDDSLEPLDLIYLAIADGDGRIKQNDEKEKLPYLLERLDIFNEIMSKPYVKGEDLVENGLKPDKSFSEILAYAHKLRLANVDKKAALAQTLNYAKKIKKH